MVLRTLLVLVSVGVLVTAREFNDEDRASFPKLFHLDDYERCLARVDGVYCLGTFELTPAKHPHPTYDLMKAYTEESYRHFNRTRIHRGYCLSTRCPTQGTSSNASLRPEHDASLHMKHDASLLFERCADKYARAMDLRASLQTFHYCRTHAETKKVQPLTTAESIFKQVVYALIVANIVGTIYDVWTEDSANKNKMLSAFSIPKNWRRLTHLREDGDPRLDALFPLEGARVTVLGLATFAHARVSHFLPYTINPENLEQVTQSLSGILLLDGTSLIQGFIVLTCFLTGYTLLTYSKKHELGLHLLPLCVIKRMIRITPVHLLIVGYAATFWMYSRDGPLVSTTIGLESEACRNKFWSHVFLTNNIVDVDKLCVTPTWFLPVNMHMYILACTFTLVIWRRRSLAVKLYTVLFIASCLLLAVIAHVKNYESMVYYGHPEQVRRVFRDTLSFTDFYISSWGALPSCFVGLIAAHIQYELDERNIKLSERKWFVYLQYAAFTLLYTWSLKGKIAKDYTSALFKASFTAMDRFCYCLLSGMSILGLIHVDGPIRKVYTWQGWRVLGRMSLTVMMLHWCVNMSIVTRPVAFGTSTLDVVVDWSATNLLTYIIAVPITVMVELPMQKFLESLFL